ncbi:hypothetical protein JCM19233_6803 [Vibrio astriarenae]|nr:hypothetical protein JCM19233_6803 [Vibrio sp. C7]
MDVTVDCLVAVLKLCLMKGAITLTLEDARPCLKSKSRG